MSKTPPEDQSSSQSNSKSNRLKPRTKPPKPLPESSGKSNPSRRRSTAANTINERTHENFLQSLDPDDSNRGTARGTFVAKWLLRIVRNSTDAIVISQLIYWQTRSKKKTPSPGRGLNHSWTAKSAVDLGKELHRSKDEMNHSLNRLRTAGFLDWKSRKFGGVKQRHIWIRWDKIQEAYRQVIDEAST